MLGSLARIACAGSSVTPGQHQQHQQWPPRWLPMQTMHGDAEYAEVPACLSLHAVWVHCATGVQPCRSNAGMLAVVLKTHLALQLSVLG